jgi:hypothetical protein
LIDVKTRGGSDTRDHYPPDYVVVRVYKEFTIDDNLWTGPVSTTTISQVIRYEWGPRTPTVTVFEKDTTITKAGTRQVVDKVHTYPRSEVWNKVTAPDAKVLG